MMATKFWVAKLSLLVVFVLTHQVTVTDAFVTPSSHGKVAGIHKEQAAETRETTKKTALNVRQGDQSNPLIGVYGEESRQYRRTVFTHDNWIKFRSPNRFLRNLRTIPQSSIYKAIANEVILVTAIATFVVIYNAVVGGYTGLDGSSNPSLVDMSGTVPLLGIPNTAIPVLGLPLIPFTTTSPFVGLLLVFRTNSSYKRWDEARKAWGLNINHTRDLVRMATSWYGTNMDPNDIDQQRRAFELRQVSLMTWAFVRSMKRHLSPEAEDEDAFKLELYERLTSDQAEVIINAVHRPNKALQMLSASIDKIPMHFIRKNEVNNAVSIFEDTLGGCERLLSSPVPLFYTAHTARLISLWIYVLPFALYDPFAGSWNHIAMIPAATVISICIFGIEELAIELEEPFTILPMQGFCDKIGANCDEIVSWAGDKSATIEARATTVIPPATVVEAQEPLLEGKITSEVPAVPGTPQAYLETIEEGCDADAPSLECADAITGYLDALSTGNAKPSSQSSAVITSYLDSISAKRPSEFSSSDDAVTSFTYAVATGAVESPTPQAVKSYLADLSTGAVTMPTTTGAIASYLSTLDKGAGGGPPTGSGPVSYLDALSELCDADSRSPECTEAITDYLGALSSGKAAPSQESAAAITSYIDKLSSTSPTAPTRGSSANAITSYLDALSAGNIQAPSLEAVDQYMEALSSGDVSTPSSAASIASYLGSAPAPPEKTLIEEACEPKQPSEECAEAITDYLGELSAGTSQPTRESAAAITSYLDTLAPGGAPPASTSATAVTSYLDAMTSGVVEAPSPQAVGSYLDALSTGVVTTPSSGATIASYLSTLGTGAAGVPTGSGPTSYLDSISEACLAKDPSPDCTEAMTDYFGAVSTGAAAPSMESADTITQVISKVSESRPTSETAAAVTSYLDSLTKGSVDSPTPQAVGSYLNDLYTGDTAPPSNPAAMTSYLSTLDTGASRGPAGSGVRTYLDSISENCNAIQASGECADAITTYLDAVSAGAETPTTESASAITSYLESISGTVAPAAPVQPSTAATTTTQNDQAVAMEMQSLKAQQSQAASEVAALQTSLASKEAQMMTLANEKSQIEQDMREGQKQALEEINALRFALNAKVAAYQKLEYENSFVNEVKEKEQKVAEEEIGQLRAAVAYKEDQLSALESEKTLLFQEKQQQQTLAQDEMAALQSVLSAKETMLSSLEEQKQDLLMQLKGEAVLQAELNDLRQRQAQADAEKEALRDELNAKQTELMTLEYKNDAADSEKRKLLFDLETLKKSFVRVEASNQAMEQNIQLLQNKISTLTSEIEYYTKTVGGVAAESNGGATVSDLIDDVSKGAVQAPSFQAVGSYLNALSSGQVDPPTNGGNVGSYMSQFESESDALDSLEENLNRQQTEWKDAKQETDKTVNQWQERAKSLESSTKSLEDFLKNMTGKK